MCPPTAIGYAARNAYRRRVSDCNSASAPRHGHDSQRLRRHKTTDSLDGFDLRRGPSELQFISLFGYLQNQCRRRRSSQDHPQQQESGPPYRRNSQNGGGDHSPSAAAAALISVNCSLIEYTEMMNCEEEIRMRQPKRHNSILERHKLLKTKLEASSRLLQFTETRPEEECLMVFALFFLP